ncbi:hypothetical protein BGZ63DRAFT_349262 [Mariannaea sp. PMI_226]|nr:hypothetical protein BGZ63DRAFT_349262 [Mariannaea sp. PMI_226]
MPITLKRKAPEADVPPRPASAIPSTLPPSVEEAYRRKCIQLKNRTNEVENSNDAARLRLARIKRQVEKLRIERAFLLEQLAKRTSTNVEDSDGSPSPPPTNLDGLAELMVNPRKPKDKPLRTKRGHRKSVAVDIESKSNAAGADAAQSPTDETHPNGVSKSKKPADAFEIFADEQRESLEAKKKDGDSDLDVEEELARLWKELPSAEKDEFQTKFEKAVAKAEEEEKKEDSSPKKSNKHDKRDKDSKPEESDRPNTQDEDVEMANYDTEDQDTQADKADD